jgi:hypothetical protein
MTIKKTLTAALAVAAVAAPAASAAPADVVTLPGAHHIPAQTQDLRSPDQSSGYLPHAPQSDLRSPDTIDSAVRPPSEVTVVEIPQSAPSASGLDWENVGLGAGAAFGLALLTAGGFVVAGKRRGVPA